MHKRHMMMTLGVIACAALLALAAPGPATAQDDVPGVDEPRPDGPWGDGPAWGGRHRHGGPDRGALGFGRGPEGPGPHGLLFALRALDLSASQREEIQAIFEGDRADVWASHERMRALEQELGDQIAGDPYDEEAVRAKASAVASLRVEMAVLRARQAGQVRKVLTPEQLESLERMKEERRAFRDERIERFGQRRGRHAKP